MPQYRGGSARASENHIGNVAANLESVILTCVAAEFISLHNLFSWVQPLARSFMYIATLRN
jgi:hypothetical protein